MSRFYTEIDSTEFQSIVKKVFREDSILANKRICKDLSKVDFDWENYTRPEDDYGFSNYPYGFEEIASLFPIYWGSAGGDWEFPVCYILYWDGELRGYIPREGNAWNTKTNMSWNNENSKGEGDEEEIAKSIDKNLMVKDILRRIKKRS